MVCPKCDMIFASGNVCPHCGYKLWEASEPVGRDLQANCLEQRAIRTSHKLRHAVNRFLTFEHKTLFALVVLIVLAVIALTVFSCIG